MEGAAGDEQDVVGADHAVLGRHRRPFDERQQVALHALARDIGAVRIAARGDLVDLVEEDDAVLLDVAHGVELHFLVIDQLAGLFVDEQLARLADLQLARLLARPAHVLEHALDLRRQFFHARRRKNLGLHRRPGDFDFDLLVVELALAQLLAEFLPRRVLVGRLRVVVETALRRRQQHVEDTILGRILGAHAHRLHRFLTAVLDGDFGEIADDRFDVAPDVADLGEFRRLDLDERRVGQPRQAARDLGLADAGRPDHQNVFRRDLLAQRLADLRAPPAVAQRNRHGLLGLALADDVLVEFVNDFLRSHLRHGGSALSNGTRALCSHRPTAVANSRELNSRRIADWSCE